MPGAPRGAAPSDPYHEEITGVTRKGCRLSTAVCVHVEVTLEVDVEAVVDAAARNVGRGDAPVNIVRAGGGPR